MQNIYKNSRPHHRVVEVVVAVVVGIKFNRFSSVESALQQL